jgi:glycosyltransferase involved in cell wall biosynthesis
LRILYHHRTRGRHVEGVHIRGIVHALRELGHVVEVMSFPGADPEREPAPDRSNADGGRLSRLVAAVPGRAFEVLELLYNAVTWWRVGSALSRRRPDLIYERYSLFLFASVWLARRHDVPVILEVNDSAVVERVRPLGFRGIARRIESWCMRNATGLVFISTRFLELARTAHGDIAPAVVSPNAVDARQFDPARHPREAERQRRGIAAEEIVCGYIGVFAHWHGVEQFVAQIAPRLAQVPALTLLLVGDGKAWPAVKALVDARGLAGRVRLPGRVPHADIAAWIATMDFAVLPDSNEYGSPMKLFEYMAMGVAVVAPDYDPVREVIADGETGWLFPRRDFERCVDKVLALAGERDALRSRGAAAARYVKAHRTWSRNAEQFLELARDRGRRA